MTWPDSRVGVQHFEEPLVKAKDFRDRVVLVMTSWQQFSAVPKRPEAAARSAAMQQISTDPSPSCAPCEYALATSGR